MKKMLIAANVKYAAAGKIMGLHMSVRDFLKDRRVIQELTEKDYRSYRYLAALSLAREQPYDGINVPIDRLHWFHIKQLFRVMKDWNLLGDARDFSTVSRLP